ncbi:MAG TPA: UDP-N-acetylglucosamine 2-epimerase (non-hydrolyzing) [Gemmatimonadales bacterium]|nr:UDP-N-acetylglucosamine 2-epimerase (non-hydrolyzing) [Gemmatimonadales bacterium]
MRIAIVVGTRPEIVKMAPVVRACRARGVPYVLLHTGQHYSHELNDIFFDELGLPQPDHNLEVGSGSAVEQISRIMTGMEPLLRKTAPDVVLVEGDTNSVLAAALAAFKIGIPVGHVEAGLRSYDRRMPEEVNRILTDHLSDYLFAPTDTARGILRGEGIADTRIHLTGNTVVDELLLQRGRAEQGRHFRRFAVEPGGYALATVHRAENTDHPGRLANIFTGLSASASELRMPVLAALHPRTVARLSANRLGVPDNVRVIPPLGYLEFLGLHASAALMLTDSGGLQEEACTLRVPCVTLRENTERPESLAVGANELAGTDPARIVEAACRMIRRPRQWLNPFGDGRSGERIISLLAA